MKAIWGAFSLAFVLACAASNPDASSRAAIAGPRMQAEIVSDEPVASLAPDEGILVVHVDSDAPLETLAAGEVVVARDLAKGRYVWLVRMPAGKHAWTRIAMAPLPIAPEMKRHCRRDRVARFDPTRDLVGVDRSEFEFQVTAGMLNYSGELILRAAYHQQCQSVFRMMIRNRNHSAMALRSLLKTHPLHLKALPIRYGGRSGDGFLEYWARESRRLEP